MSESIGQHTDTPLDLMPVERLWGRYMAQVTQTLSVRTGCLTGSDIIELAEQGEDSKDYGTNIEHIITCTQCRRLLKESRALLKATAEVPVPVESSLLTKVKRTLRLPAWLTLITVSRPHFAHAGFSFADTALLPTKLEFDNSRARGSYIAQDQSGYVHIEHPDLEPGTLIYISFLEDRDEHWQEKAGYFAVLMEDYCPSAEILVPLKFLAGSQVSISRVEPFLLPDTSADALRKSRASAIAATRNEEEKQEATETAWQMFAQQVLRKESPRTLAPQVRAAFEELANQS